jgi:hypothetical protein
LPETHKQKLRKLLDRLTIDGGQKRELDKLIEEADEEDARMLIDWMEDMEREAPGSIEKAIETINANGGFPDDD